MKRSILLATISACAALALQACGPELPAPPPERPHVLLISLDTLRADRVGSYGHDRDTTPFLDELAARGTRFEHSFVNTHGTPPSHATLFTSLYQLSHGVSMHEGGIDHYLPEALPILPQVLRDAGWQTVAVTGGGFMSSEFGWSRGFDAFDEAELEPGADRLARLIERRAGKGPVFAFFHTYEIHSPYDPPPDYQTLWGPLATEVDASSAALKEMSKGEVTEDQLEALLQLYDAGIRYTDDVLRRLFRRLDEIGFLEHALVIITSDHGEEFEERGRLLHPVSLYEELVAVPLMLAGPGVAAGKVDGRLASLLDIAPTIYSYLGVRAPRLASGMNLLAEGVAGPEQVFMQYGDILHGVRTRRFKLIENPKSGYIALFDLENDPGELENLAFKRPGVTAELQSRLESWREAAPRLRSLRAQPRQISDERIEELRALGYVD